MTRGFLGKLALGVAALFVAPLVCAQDPSLVLTNESGTVAYGQNISTAVMFDNTGSDNVDGWSYGVCHDTALLDIVSADSGATTISVNGGAAPGFESLTVNPALGYTQGIVIDLFGANKLAPGTGYEFTVGNYQSNTMGTMPTSTDICFCSTIGSPPVATVVVIAGVSIQPTTNCGTIDLVVGPPPFKYIAPDVSINFDGNTGIAEAANVELSIAENPMNPGYPNDTQGFSLGLSHDATFLSPTLVSAGTALQSLNGGTGPAFFTAGVMPSGGDGITLGVVYSLMGGQFLQFAAPSPVAEVSYSVDASTLTGTMAATTTALVWSDLLGSPPVANVTVVSGTSLDVVFCDGSVTLNPVYDLPFLRGDCNDDGTVNIADGVWIINQVTGIGDAGTCFAGCDANADGFNDLSDAIYILSYRFLAGPEPTPPFPNCDIEAGADCAEKNVCP